MVVVEVVVMVVVCGRGGDSGDGWHHCHSW